MSNDTRDVSPNLNDEPTQANQSSDDFDFSLVKAYPRSNRKIPLQVSNFGISNKSDCIDNGQSLHISPHGIEFRTNEEFSEGALLKIHINLPNYWERKQKFVDYTRIDTPTDFRVLAKVVKTEDIGKRSKKRLVTVKTIIIDDVDEKVLKSFLQDE